MLLYKVICHLIDTVYILHKNIIICVLPRPQTDYRTACLTPDTVKECIFHSKFTQRISCYHNAVKHVQILYV